MIIILIIMLNGASLRKKQLEEEKRKGLTNDSDVVLGGLELPEGDIDRDTTLTLGL